MKRQKCVLAAIMAGSIAVAQERPNIILFLVDDMGVMDSSVAFLTNDSGETQYHDLNRWYNTPNMEKLASQGVRFSTFYAQSVSSPSRVSILTGQNSARHHTTNWINSTYNNRTEYGPHNWNWEGVKSDTPIYPKLLQQTGYRTIHIGKAHFGCKGSESENPLNIGFDINIGGSSIGEPGSYYGQWGYGYLQGYKPCSVPGLEKYHGSDTFLTEALTLEAEAEIEKAVIAGEPFYLNLSHYAVHNPFQADTRFIERYKESGKVEQAEAFATLVEGIDHSLGRIMQKLCELDIAQNTIILLLGDNGSDAPLGAADDRASSAPLRGKKGSEYEGGVRVPFIASWAVVDSNNKFQKAYPIATNLIQQQQATIMDIYPTILSIANIDVPDNYVLDGSDLKKLLSGKKDREHRRDFLMHFPHGEHRANYFTTYRLDDWKLIYYYNPDNPDEATYKLYNLATDPYEQTDLSLTHPHKASSMIRAMRKRLLKENALYPVDSYGNPCIPQKPTSKLNDK